MSLTNLARLWPAIAALSAGLLLALAHASQTFGGLAPCELCLQQRDIYWVALVVGALCALGLRAAPRLARPACLLLALFFAAEAGLAAYHAGVEWKFWPGPSACTGAAAHKLSVADMTALLQTSAKRMIVQCDVAAFRLLGLSMAGWNALAATALCALSLLFASRSVSPK